ncbi:MAG: UDP-N-acetylmuramate:L-alanyl-gamma-D-glutamyl-meso-diaminopimelate ligase [Verrucomicrobia bacterium]|nr:UDP-N-acetylmuramate:L-alanyl-gamma-D-glutamyl-meso-diaminopimelate ligase [Verrucomicrobiota bacterium]
MLDRAQLKHLHFLGIAGTGMGTVAAMFRELGLQVTGSDQTVYPPMSDFLRERGVAFHEGYQEKNLTPRPDLAIVGNVLSRGNPELEAVLTHRIPFVSLPELLRGWFLYHSRNLVVAGTHGKTTTSTMLAFLLEKAGIHPSWFIGGIPIDLPGGCHRGTGSFWVLEGDEYDTSFADKRSKFLHYLPELVILNNVEFDHADIYPNLAAIQKSFRQLLQLVPRNGLALVNADDPRALEVAQDAPCEILEVGSSPQAAARYQILKEDAAGSRFTLHGQEFHLQLAGRHNVHNASMALAAAHTLGLPLNQLASILPDFRGVRRRLEVRAEAKGITLVDDFGHHPSALRESIAALRAKYPGRRLWALFEPRSNTTRRAIFQHDLAKSLSAADGVYISEVARRDQLDPLDCLDPEKLTADIRKAGRESHYLPGAEEILKDILPRLKSGDVVAVFTNGSFGGLVGKLAAALNL